MTKVELRRKIEGELSQMDQNQRIEANAAIRDQVRALPEWDQAETVLGYLAMRREVSVDDLLGDALNAGKRLAVPSVTDTGILFREIETANGPFIRGAYGIREPGERCPVLEVATLTSAVLLVPGLGFDQRGARLGRGGGYYDRLLAELPESVIRVGVAFSCQLRNELPTDSHDLPIDLLATESSVHRF